MVLASVAGAVLGIAGFLPLLASLELAKRVTDTSNLGHAGAMLLGVFASFLILIGAVLACFFIAREAVVPFAVAEAAGLVVSAAVFGMLRLVRK